MTAQITPAARALLRAGGAVTLSITTADTPAARVALDETRRRLYALNDGDVGDGEGVGPSFVADPVAVPGGFLLAVDLGGVPPRGRRALPSLLAEAWDGAGAGVRIDAPPRMPESPFLVLMHRETLVGELVAYARQRRFPFTARECASWGALLDIGLAWLTGGAGERVAAGVVGPGGPFAIDLDGADLAAAVGAVLGTGGAVELARRTPDGDRYLRLEAVLHAALSAAWLPSEQSVAAVAAGLDPLIALLERQADGVLWAGADLKDSTRSGYALPYADGPIATDDRPRPVPLGPRIDVVTAAYPWQILSPAVRTRLPERVPGAEERPLPGGGAVVRFGTWQEWAPGDGRAAARAIAWSALEPVIADDLSRRHG
ncbi:hypothetical protein [Cellulomonas sp. Y8]|uniref:hypothetical protein n=1 Tax=Cellulomonas sp. Y8 TaxID=2591145 RepID=UPI0011CBD658|nr:hypothetical protein [Cellulomonas sp. Y8]